MSTVKENIENLQKAFTEYKSTQEAKGDVLVEAKLANISDEMDKIEGRLEKMHAAMNRPSLSVKSEAPYKDDTHQGFMQYIKKGDESALQDIETKSLSAGSDPDGGFLVSDQLSNSINTTIGDHSAMRKLANVVKISTDAVELLVSKKGAEAGWVTETGERGDTATPKLVKVRIPVHEIFAKPKATQKLLDDSKVDVDSWLTREISEKLAQMENQSFINGDGEGKPKGILAHALKYDGFEWGKIQALKTGKKGEFHENGGDKLIDLVNLLKAAHLGNASWLMPRSALACVRKLKDSTGQYLWQPSLDQKNHSTLLGFPIVISDDMPGVVRGVKSNSIAFGNFKAGYTIVDRNNTRVLRDPFSSKPYIEFYTTRRIGGDVVDFDAIKVLSFSD
ncbi:MAG: phage major capsid protein [Alphaproteobacteria bacterium]